jgi:methyltransferase-like protein/2-polyprenyl-3-methyl-5-hydroxy-6-metoxy-1,4-benzoquinol methylase
VIASDEHRVRDSYDRVPYVSGSQHHTHPDHLATLARLHGLESPLPGRCRVLELGCADGGNLIPMAVELPEAAFVGIDLSPRQIEDGLREVRALGLTNVDLRAMSIADVDASLGTFDYIICHGVFSWVAPEVQQKILAVCKENLAPNGVAYVSYNTYPGWHLRRMMREMLLFHTRGVDDPGEKTARAFELVQFLAETAGEGDDPHSQFLRSSRDHFEEYRDRPSYVLHEYLEETNAPLYFHEFAAQAAGHGLQPICEAEAHEASIDNLSPSAAQRLRELAPDPIEAEQYLDFVLNRTFRRTLLCHAEAPLDRTMNPQTMRTLFAASPCKPLSNEPDLRATVSESFRTERGKEFSSSHPVAKATLVALSAIWPRAASFDALLADVRRRIATDGVDDDDILPVLPDLLHALFWSGVVALHVVPPDCTNVVTGRPQATAFARRQAAKGLLVTNQRHRVLKLDDPMARFLLLQLDGTHDRAALLRLLDREVSAGRLDITADGAPIKQPQRIPAVLEAVLEHHLRRMAQLALLVA